MELTSQIVEVLCYLHLIAGAILWIGQGIIELRRLG